MFWVQVLAGGRRQHLCVCHEITSSCRLAGLSPEQQPALLWLVSSCRLKALSITSATPSARSIVLESAVDAAH